MIGFNTTKIMHGILLCYKETVEMLKNETYDLINILFILFRFFRPTQSFRMWMQNSFVM